MSLVQDPSSRGVAAYTISMYSNIPTLQSFKVVWGLGNDMVAALAALIRNIIDLRTDEEFGPSTQFYVYSAAEHALLQRHLIDTALTVGPHDFMVQTAVRLCIGALSEGASLLTTAFQPLVLSGALLDFLGKKGARKKAELQMCAGRLGLSSDGTVEQLRLRIMNEIERLKREGGRSLGSRMELGQLPRIVVVAREVERLLALPIPGYWDLVDCASCLLSPEPSCPSDDDIFVLHKDGKSVQVKIALQRRNWCIFGIVKSIRTRVSSSATGKPELLVNNARVLSADFMDICRQEHLRKLFFMQQVCISFESNSDYLNKVLQFEVLAKLTELWRSRIDGCPDAPILAYRGSPAHAGVTKHQFTLISGSLDIPADKDRAFFDYLLTEDCDTAGSGNDSDQSNIPVEALFDDLGVSGLVFPLNRYTKVKWEEQHPLVQSHLLVADLRDIDIQGNNTIVTIQTWGNYNVKLLPGHHYRLSPRLIDFNLAKVLSTLLELDLRVGDDEPESTEVPFVQLMTNPRSLAFDQDNSHGTSDSILKAEINIQTLFRELHELGSDPAGKLLLKASQRHATRRILSQRLTVIWGPPGELRVF